MGIREDFEKYMLEEKNSSPATVSAYISDINEFEDYLKAEREKTVEKAGNADVVAFLMKLKNSGRRGSTVNRKLASVRIYYSYLEKRGRVRSNPTDGIKSPRVQRKELDFLSVEEVEKLLGTPGDDEKGLRDKAILELMYATGMRAGEIAAADASDINLQIGFIQCGRGAKGRVIPVGRLARKAVREYMAESRQKLLGRKEDCGALFLNYAGERMTRQGIWKILKFYGEQAGFGDRIGPQMLRNSFAAHMVQNGADLKSLQELLGYEDIMAAKIFLSVSKNRIMDVYDRTHPRA